MLLLKPNYLNFADEWSSSFSNFKAKIFDSLSLHNENIIDDFFIKEQNIENKLYYTFQILLLFLAVFEILTSKKCIKTKEKRGRHACSKETLLIKRDIRRID